MQRRADLIPNLVETVKGYAAHETDVFASIANARSAMLGASTRAEKIDKSNALDSALGRLFSLSEAYPQLKSDAQYTRLMDELAGTENRLAVERKRYNEAVQVYNTDVKQIPGAWFAKLGNFPAQKEYFKAPQTSLALPKVSFQQ
jgi:LemA protein